MDLAFILERLKIYQARLYQKRWIILVVAISFCAAMVIYGSQKPTLFTAMTTFHPDIDQRTGGALDPLSLIMGGDDPGSGTSLMIGVLKSRTLSEMVVSDSVEIDGEKMLIADAVIRFTQRPFSLSRYINSWVDEPREPSYQQKITSTASSIRNSVNIRKNLNGFIEFDLTRSSQKLAAVLSRTYIEKIKEYYNNQRTEKAMRNLMFLLHRRDSVKAELDRANYAVAENTAKLRYSVYERDRIGLQEWMVKQQVLQSMYLSLVNSTEQALVKVQQDTPVIQVLDYPSPPFPRTSPSLFQYAILGGILGLSLMVFFFTRKLLLEDLVRFVRQSLEAAQQPVEG